MSIARRINKPQGLLVLAAAGLLTLAACGGGGSAAAGDASAASLEAEILDYTECLRDQGINVGDPVVEPDGSVRMGNVMITPPPGQRGGPGGGDQPFAPMQRAREACGQPPAGAMSDRGDPTEMQDAVLAFAQCMRDNGVDMPDPEFTGTGGVAFGAGAGLNPDDPSFQAAHEECRDHLPGGGSGVMRGGPGGPGN